MISLLESFYYFEIPNNFVKNLKTYFMFSRYYNTILHGKFALCVAV